MFGRGVKIRCHTTPRFSVWSLSFHLTYFHHHVKIFHAYKIFELCTRTLLRNTTTWLLKDPLTTLNIIKMLLKYVTDFNSAESKIFGLET